MSAERPFEISHLVPRLRRDFTGLLPESTHGTASERENNFLSRALAAFAIQKFADCSLAEAAAAVVDGRGDGGIDAIFYSVNLHTLWIVQSKYFESGRGEPDLGDVSKFRNGVENLLGGRFEVFGSNVAWADRLKLIASHMQDSALRVRAVLVYSSLKLVSDDRVQLFEELSRRFHPDRDYLVFCPYNLTSLHALLAEEQSEEGVPELQLEIFNPGWITHPFETIYGQVRLSDLARIQSENGNRMIVGNIRRYKGATEVNERIVATLQSQPERFFYLNNGMTAYCGRLEVNNLDRTDGARKRVKVFDFSIVNGAQTLGAIHDAFGDTMPDPEAGFVFIKIISLARCDDDEQFAKNITTSTNFQNQIGVRDFAALDEQQKHIADQIRLSGITYHYKDGDEPPPVDDTNFSIDEATTALACLEQESSCDLVARMLADRKSLLSMEEVYPETDIFRSRYLRVFRSDRSARTIWRAVLTRRVSIAKMQEDGRSATGIRKAFYEAARWLVLNILFLKTKPERGEDLRLTADEIKKLSTETIAISEALWNTLKSLGYITTRAATAGTGETEESPRHLRSVFCDASDCARIRVATLATLAAAMPQSNGGA